MDPEDTPRVAIQSLNGKYSIETVTNPRELDLTIGPRYMQNEIRCNAANYLGLNTSGVMGEQSQQSPAETWLKFSHSLFFLLNFSIGNK